VTTYKSGDLWKVIGLVVLIAATFLISFRFLRTSGVRPAAPPRPPQGAAQAATAPAAPGREMFAQREPPPSELLTRARGADDPFKPYVTAASTTPSRSNAAAAAGPKSAGPLPPLRTPQEPEYRLVGLVTGSYPLAVIAGDGTRYFVRLGDSLPSGWRISKLDRRSLTLTKGSDSTTLTMAKPPPST